MHFSTVLSNLKYFSSLQFAHACDFHFLGLVHRLFLCLLWLSQMSRYRIHFTLTDSKLMYLLYFFRIGRNILILVLTS